MTEENRSFLLAILLSLAVLVGWNVFIAAPRIEDEQKRIEKTKNAGQVPQVPGAAAPATPGTPSTPGTAPISTAPTGLGQTITQGSTTAVGTKSRDAVIANAQRIAIDTPALKGSINLKGAHLDDLVMLRYRETTAEGSPPVSLLSPIGAKNTFYIEHGWASPTKGTVVGGDTVWTAETSGPLTPSSSVTLRHDNGEGLVFRRTISVDDNYMFTVKQEVENTGAQAEALFPFAFSSRHGKPVTENIWILHEGLIGVFEKEGLTEVTYDDAVEAGRTAYEGKTGWVSITDKYWATALIPDQTKTFKAEMVGQRTGETDYYQANYALGALNIAPGAKQVVEGRVFAGAKRANLIRKYEEDLKLNQFNFLVSWGYFYFITKPLSTLLNWFYGFAGNY